MGLIIGVLYSVMVLVLSRIGASQGGAQVFGVGVAMALGVLIGIPLVYGLMGMLAGLISALCFNLAARFVGGVKIQTK